MSISQTHSSKSYMGYVIALYQQFVWFACFWILDKKDKQFDTQNVSENCMKSWRSPSEK